MSNRAWAKDAPPQLVILSGAGLSAPSGVPTFRGSADGLWHNHKLEVVCNALTWKQNWEIVHRFYNMLRQDLAAYRPNAAHQRLAAWTEHWPGRVHHITQNVDDLTERALAMQEGGVPPLHVHGFLPDMHCTACGHIWTIGYAAFDTEQGRCPQCQSHRGVKPRVVFFHDDAPNYPAMRKILRSLRAIDQLLVIGTSGQVLPVAEFAMSVPCRVVLANLDADPLLPDWLFARTIMGSCTDTIDIIEADIVPRMEG